MNPAVVFCIKGGGTHVISKTADVSETGVYAFPHGTEVDDWTYFWAHAPHR